MSDDPILTGRQTNTNMFACMQIKPSLKGDFDQRKNEI